VVEQLGRILGCPWDPLDSMRAVCGGTTREDPGMSMGSSGQHGGLCVGGQLGRIL